MSPFFSTVECRDGRAALRRWEDGSYGLVTYDKDNALPVTLTLEQARKLLAPFPELREAPLSPSEAEAALDSCNWVNERTPLTPEQRQGFDLALSCVGRFLGVPATLREESPCPAP